MYDSTKIGRSMIVFLAALLLVYIVFMDSNTLDDLDANASTVAQSLPETVFDELVSPSINPLLSNKKNFDAQTSSVTDSFPIQSQVIEGKKFFSTQALFGIDQDAGLSSNDYVSNVFNMVLLDDTHVWDGEMKLLSILKLNDNSQYILKDNNNTHYVNLGIFNEDLSFIVQNVGGTYVDMSDQFIINDNQYFGVRVQRVTIPSYKNNLKEIRITSLNSGESRLIQMDANTGNSVLMKLEIKARFERYYTL